jgi:riboflavin kinase / FMN adenylyltransferase
MKLYRSLNEVPADFGPSALTIGNFDGLHAAHRRILRRVVAVAAERGLRPSVLTFDPHPASVVAPERTPRLMTTPEQRARLMESEGIEQVLIQPFTAAFGELSPVDFVESVVVGRLGAKAVLVGHNFRFGRGQAGSVELLERLGEGLGFETEVVPAVRRRGLAVSSSELRRQIGEGRVSLAWRLLERPYSLEGAVVSGRGIGSKQTVPTLNLATDSQVVPAAGVYVTRTTDLADGRRWRSVTNVGYRPTFGASGQLSIETFLLEALDSPPARIRVEFLYRLREERTFPSPAALKAQILRDAARAQTWFRRSGR